MTKHPLSKTPKAQQARERRLTERIKKEEAAFNAEVRALMDTGLEFEAAWVAAGGSIFPLDNGEDAA